MPLRNGDEHAPELLIMRERGRGREVRGSEVREERGWVRREVREGRGEPRLGEDGEEEAWCEDV